MKQKIRMLKSTLGADNGIHCHEYMAGKEYVVSKNLAKNFIVMNVAESVDDEKAKATHENKALDSGDYQNKSRKRNKS
jgi:hypothetical protein